MSSLLCALLLGVPLGIRMALRLRRALAALRHLKELERRHAAEADGLIKLARALRSAAGDGQEGRTC